MLLVNEAAHQNPPPLLWDKVDQAETHKIGPECHLWMFLICLIRTEPYHDVSVVENKDTQNGESASINWKKAFNSLLIDEINQEFY